MMADIKLCYFCEKNDEPTFPIILKSLEFGDDRLHWTCKRHLWPGHVVVDAFTGLPIVMAGREEEDYSGYYANAGG
jgi:hypothetical protein